MSSKKKAKKEKRLENDLKARICCYVCQKPLHGACTVDDNLVRHATCINEKHILDVPNMDRSRPFKN